MIVVDTRSGTIVAKLPIGRGSDAIAFDPVRKRVFSSNGIDGTISVYQQVSPDRYEALETLQTAITGRTMAVDPRTGRLYVAAAEVDPPATPGGAPRRKPGSLRVLIFDPAS
jgi:DNA-binding beta-propeller fold protein YncE